MKITKEEAIDVVFNNSPDWKSVEKEIVGQRRWVTEYESIHKHIPSGKYYRFYYDLPSTESSGDWMDTLWLDETEVEIEEVEQVEVAKLVWMGVI